MLAGPHLGRILQRLVITATFNLLPPICDFEQYGVQVGSI